MSSHLKQLPSTWIIDSVNTITNNKELKILDFASGHGRHSTTLASNKRKITTLWFKRYFRKLRRGRTMQYLFYFS